MGILLTLLRIFGPVIFKALEKTGYVNAAERVAVKFGFTVMKDIDNLKMYYEYPKGKNGK